MKIVYAGLMSLTAGLMSGEAFSRAWVGDYGISSARGSMGGRYPICERYHVKQDLDSPFVIGSWDRTRALVTHLCFSVYWQGISDRDDARGTDLSAFVPLPISGSVVNYPATFVRKEGNNFIFAVDLKELDPLPYGASRSGNTAEELEMKPRVNAGAFGQGWYDAEQAVKVKFSEH